MMLDVGRRARHFGCPPPTPTTTFLAKVFRGLGDPTRLRLLAALGAGERTVGELVDELEVPQPRVSSHLAALRWCGFVTSRREHRSVHYRVADPRVLELVAAAQGVVADHRRPAVRRGDPGRRGSAPLRRPRPRHRTPPPVQRRRACT